MAARSRHRETRAPGRRAGQGGSHPIRAGRNPGPNGRRRVRFLQFPDHSVRYEHTSLKRLQDIHRFGQHKVMEGAGIGHDDHAGLSTFSEFLYGGPVMLKLFGGVGFDPVLLEKGIQFPAGSEAQKHPQLIG